MINERNARKFCSEDLSKIEGYQEAVADLSQTWHIHHRRETDEGLSERELRRRGEYFQRPASELIFLTGSKHTSLHMLGNKYRRGKHLSEATRKKLSVVNSGEINGFFGKHHTDATKRKLSAANLGNTYALGAHRSAEMRKKTSEAMSGENHPFFGYHWYTDGLKNVRAQTCPPGFHPGRAFLHWWNDGTRSIKAVSCPPGFHPGRI